MPHATPSSFPPWAVMWTDRRTGCVRSGDPVCQTEAERWAEVMNETWPEIHHWAAPLAACPTPPAPEALAALVGEA